MHVSMNRAINTINTILLLYTSNRANHMTCCNELLVPGGKKNSSGDAGASYTNVGGEEVTAAGIDKDTPTHPPTSGRQNNFDPTHTTHSTPFSFRHQHACIISYISYKTAVAHDIHPVPAGSGSREGRSGSAGRWSTCELVPPLSLEDPDVCESSTGIA